YAENPIFPLAKTLANINIDGANVYGRNDNHIEVIGFGYTTLEDILRDVVAHQGRTVIPDQAPEAGHYFRSDQFSFAKKGVPALFTKSVTPEDYKEYTAKRYHKLSDKFDPNWDMKAAADDARVLLQVALAVANAENWPRRFRPTSLRGLCGVWKMRIRRKSCAIGIAGSVSLLAPIRSITSRSSRSMDSALRSSTKTGCSVKVSPAETAEPVRLLP